MFTEICIFESSNQAAMIHTSKVTNTMGLESITSYTYADFKSFEFVFVDDDTELNEGKIDRVVKCESKNELEAVFKAFFEKCQSITGKNPEMSGKAMESACFPHPSTIL